MKKPILLTKYELLEPINLAIERLEKIRQRKATNEDSIILEGLFVLANSTFENSIFDTLRVLIKNIPEKIDIKEEKVNKDILLNGSALEETIEKRIIRLSYDNLKEVINYFTRTTGIHSNNILSDNYNKLCEIKSSRNLLLHNNLVVNSIYLETAGINKRSSEIGEKLVITQDYLFDSIIVFKSILRHFKSELEVKYRSYTYINAIRNLFKYIFPTPVMKFENEFNIDENSDKIIGYNKDTSMRNSLSHSEEIYFSIWLSHLEGKPIKLNSNLNTITNKDKLAYFISAIDILKNM